MKTPSSPTVVERDPLFELLRVARMGDSGRRPVGLMRCALIERSPPVPELVSPRGAPMLCPHTPVCRAQSRRTAKSKRGSAGRRCEVLTDTFLYSLRWMGSGRLTVRTARRPRAARRRASGARHAQVAEAHPSALG